MNLNLSLREEISLCLLIFFIAIMTIPVILRSSSSVTTVSARTRESAVERTLRNELLMNSISILEINNRITRNSSKIELSAIIYLPSKVLTDLLKDEIKDVERRRRAKPKTVHKATRKAWEKFTFIKNSTLKSNSLRLPLKVDWRHEMDVVSRVKEQNCGDCFAVAVIETIESMYAIKHGKLMNLSVEKMDECNDLAMGCNGGNPSALLHWLLTANHGKVMTQENFLETNKSCTNANEVDDSSDAAAKVEDYSHNNFTGHEELMLLYLAYNGPLIAEINAAPIVVSSASSYQQRKEIMLDQTSCRSDDNDDDEQTKNHVVQIVGYDLIAPIPFFLVRNSYGLDFGSEGYFRIAIGSNVCGVAEGITTILVK